MKKIALTIVMLCLIVLLVSCQEDLSIHPIYINSPTAITGLDPGTIILNAELDQDEGTIYYVIVSKGVTPPTANQIIDGYHYRRVTVHASGNSGIHQSILDKQIRLKEDHMYTVYFVIYHQNTLHHLYQTDVMAASRNYPSLLRIFQIRVFPHLTDPNAFSIYIPTTSALGLVIYLIITDTDAQRPSSYDVLKGESYKEETIYKFIYANSIYYYVISDLDMTKNYAIHAVVSDGLEVSEVYTLLFSAETLHS
jgi:hypothetical protein